jgi:Spy/CpxP family protein refolding chaperone
MAALALLALSVPVPAFSEITDMSIKDHRKEDGHMMVLGNMEKMGDMTGMCIEDADKMGISSEQIVKMKPVMNKMEKKQARFNADLKITEINLMETMEMKDFDLKKAGNGLKKIAGIKTAHNLEMLKAMKEMRTILTDDQFNKMKKMATGKTGDKKTAKL